MIKNNPINFLGMKTLEEEIEWRNDHRKNLEAEVYFAECRLAYILQKNDTRLFLAEKYYERYRKKGPDGLIGLSKKDDLNAYRDYRPRVAFLSAASLALPSLLNFDAGTIQSLSNDIPGPSNFRVFCMHARAISDKLGVPGSAQLQRWTGVETLMPDIPAIPDELAATWEPKTRRSAKTTALGDKGHQHR